MRNPKPLPVLLLLLVFFVKTSGYNVAGYTLNNNPFGVGIAGVATPGVPGVAAPEINDSIPPKLTDTVPAKAGLFKKLLQALQFRKNARAREQTRVLDIIARSGLKDSLQETVKQLNAIDSNQRTKEQVKETLDIEAVLTAIEALKQQVADLKTKGKDTPVPGEDTLLPVDEQSIQALISKMLSPLNPEEQTRLNLIRWVVQQGGVVVDTVRVDDSFVNARHFQLAKRLSIIAFYPFNSKRPAHPDLRLIDEVAWYSAGVSARDGHLSGAFDWRSSPVLDSAVAAGARLSLCVQVVNREIIRTLLLDTLKQRVLIDDIIGSLNARHADGVNILLDDAPPGSAAQLVDFIGRLSKELKRQPSHRLLSLRLPAAAPTNIYDLAKLNPYVDRFFVNFAGFVPGQPGALAPLGGTHKNDLNNCLSTYLQVIPADKLVACLPYFGARWDLTGKQWVSRPIAYADLRADTEYQQLPQYEPLSATERLDLRSKSGNLTGRLWYDDEVTLAAKYDFILQKQLGGIAIESLGDDEGCGELWDVMAAKLVTVDLQQDTIAMKKKKKPVVLDDWKWSWTYLNAKKEQYLFLFAYPCETKFPRVLVRKWEQAGLKNTNRNQIRTEAATVIGVFSIVLGLLFIAGVLLFINRIRRAGEKWKGTKPLAAILIGLFVLLTVTAFMYLFLDKHFSIFGVADDPSDCFDFPLGVLFAIVFTGILIGVLITRFLVFPMIKRHDIP